MKQAHAILDDLYRISLVQMNSKDLYRLTLFTNRVTGPPVAVSGYGVFTLTKGFILTVSIKENNIKRPFLLIVLRLYVNDAFSYPSVDVWCIITSNFYGFFSS